MDLPYRAEYAKSSRAGCKGCKTTIQQGELRLAVMVQSPRFDGKTPNWYHYTCFFKKQRPKTTDDIQHYESLRLEDQDKIKQSVEKATMAIIPDKKGKKRPGEKAALTAALKDFIIEYAKSGRAACRGCEQKILKDEIRISKKDFESDIGKKYGGQDMWHHVTCFAQLRAELAFFECGDKLPGFKKLKKDDQTQVKSQIPAIKQEDVPEIKKVKTEDAVDGDPKEAEYREQNKIIFAYRDELDAQLDAKELAALLEYNDQTPPKGKERMLDHLSDIMTFGSLVRCNKCGGQLKFTKGGYVCTGNMTEWTKCAEMVKEPKRAAFKVPPDFKEAFPFLKKYKYVPRTRIIKEVHSSVDTKDEPSEPKVKRALPPLYNMEFVILGNPPKGKEEIKKLVSSMGGKVVTKIKDTVMAVISTEDDVEKLGARMREAESNQIHVVPDDFLDEAKDNVGKIPDLIIKKSICDWGTDPSMRLPPEPSSSSGKSKSKSGSMYMSSKPSKVKLKIKGGGAVDPDSGMEDTAHVYQEGSAKYTIVLGVTDIQTKKNSFYKLQLLASDKKPADFWIFRAWGRIGTTIGGNKLESMPDLLTAKHHFSNLYAEKSGNKWPYESSTFVKVPGKMYPIEMDHGEVNDEALSIVESESKLAKPVQELIRMIFDVNTMNRQMLEFELDTEKMPLGKLSQSQIHKAFAVLGELQKLLDRHSQDESLLIDASNRFYTYIPHSFGVDDPPILRDPDVIKQKLDMLDSLMEMEIAYNLMSTGTEHTVDSYYSKLNTEIEVLDHETEEFEIIKEYVKNTHAATHSNYALEVDEVYKIKRQGEEKRFKPFRKLHNHKLLWHGSRVTNFVGILSQGLRIAPPEAPVTGYMFGKGIYFADMVSKSANYCCTNPSASKGLLLLCDVALGNVDEQLHAKYVEKLPKGKHSCKGVGRTEPDPSASKILDGIEVPLGKGVQNPKASTSSLLYNEYIVYDIAQVNVKYLLCLDFKYKY